MLSYGAGFALWTALALTKVSGCGRWCGVAARRSQPSPRAQHALGTGCEGLRGERPAGTGGWRSPAGLSELSRCSQAVPGEAAGCSANLTERRVAGQSVRLRWDAAGRACNFSLSGVSEDGEAVDCQPAPTGNGSYGCTVRGLEAGTWYLLRIEPLAGGEAVNISVQTGMGGGRGRCSGRDPGLFHRGPLLRLAAAGGERCVYSCGKPAVLAGRSCPVLEFSLRCCQK